MGNEIDDLIYEFSLGKAYEHYNKKYGSINDQFITDLQNQLKQSFVVGYNEGHQNGFVDGFMEAQLKTLVKLVVHTDSDDKTILKILERELDENFIDALKKLREKQNKQD